MKEIKRDEIDNTYKWDLSKIYKDNKSIDNDIDEVHKLTKKLLKYKGKLVSNNTTLYDAIVLYYKITRIMDKLVVYSNMKLHEDMSVSSSKVLVGKIDKLNDLIASNLSFFSPELLKTDYKIIKQFIKENPKLKEYKFALDDLFRSKKYILSEEFEAMIARLGEVFQTPTNTYEMLEAVDLVFDDIKVANEVLPLNQSNYALYLKDERKDIRKNAFKNYYKAYENHKNTFASTLYGDIKTGFFISNERGYKSPLQMALYEDNIDLKLYNNLIEKVTNRLDLLHDYMKLKKKALNLDELHMYDISAPLVKGFNKKYTYLEAKDLVLKALEPLGKDYINNLKELFDSSCIDVYHNKNKQTGAYSWGCYDTLPYVLLNFNGTANDVSTIAHELGHSMHSLYSNKNNTYVDSSYTIFLAEIASTVNEILLNKYCSKNATTKEEKLYYLNSLLESIRTTLYRQTMFAEFEYKIYNLEQKGEVLTEELLSNTYYELNKKYHGSDVISDDEIRLEWARISHFYKGFYVYKYATGIAIASKIVSDILNNKKDALDNYIKFLSSGGKDYSLNILKTVGIDIINDDTIDKALDLFKDIKEEFERNL